MARVFIIGGTLEARQVAEALGARGHVVMSSLAGVTALPRLPVGAVRIGGYGGADEMAAFIRGWGAEVLIDCAHPFAAAIKARLARLAEALDLPLWVYRRSAWQPGDGDNWHFVDDLTAGMALACRLSGGGGGGSLNGASTDYPTGDAGSPNGGRESPAVLTGGRIFAALGRQQFDSLSKLQCEFLLLRQVPSVSEPDLSDFAAPTEIISAYPPTDADEEIALLRDYKIQVILCKESGGASGGAKLTAARSLSLPVIIIRQPKINYPQKTRFFDDVGELEIVSQ